MKAYTFLFASLLLAACGGEKPTDTGRDAKAVEMAGRITDMENKLFNDTVYDQRNAQALLDVYKAYVTTFPADTLAPEYLFRAAGLASKAMGDPEQGVKLYDRVIANYPDWERLPDARFLKALTLDTELGRKGEAEQAYKEVIKRHPDHPFASDAARMIEFLRFTDEELIQHLQRQQQEVQ
jgi:TolA-binding protein